MERVRPIASFTGLRGLAALWVVAYHFRDALSGALPPLALKAVGQGYLAVDLFFILSGFVITLNYRDMFEDFRMRSARIFILARFARLYPVHLCMSVLFLLNPASIMLFSAAKDVGDRYGAGYFLLSLVLAQNWGLTHIVAWNIPAWSISTEWFAYLMFPLLLPAVVSGGKSRNSVLVVIFLLLLALAGFFSLAGVASIGADVAQLGLSRCLVEFMVGIALCQLYRQISAPGRVAQFGLVAVALSAASLTVTFGWPDFWLIPAVFALLIFGITGETTALYRLLAWRPLLWLGEISYSIYMVHYFIKDWVKFAIGDIRSPLIFMTYMILVVAAGMVLHHLVEKPGRQAFRHLSLNRA